MPQQQDEMNNILQRLLGVSPGAVLDQPVPNIPRSVTPQTPKQKPKRTTGFPGVLTPKQLKGRMQQRDAATDPVIESLVRKLVVQPPGDLTPVGRGVIPFTWLKPEAKTAFGNPEKGANFGWLLEGGQNPWAQPETVQQGNKTTINFPGPLDPLSDQELQYIFRMLPQQGEALREFIETKRDFTGILPPDIVERLLREPPVGAVQGKQPTQAPVGRAGSQGSVKKAKPVQPAKRSR